MKNENLVPLINRLKTCPAHDTRFSEKALFETWNCFTQIDVEQGDEVTTAVIAGLLLHDVEIFGKLLNQAQHAQFAALAKIALDRYQQLNNPPNKLGKLIVSTLKT